VLGAASVAPDLATIRQLEFVEAFALETMRFKPVAPIIALEPKDDVELLGYRLPAGTPIIALTRPNAISDAHFDAAASFDPARWLAHEQYPGALHNPRAHIPFGAGPRFCPGRGLAMLEIKAVLAMLCRNFDIALSGHSGPIGERLSFTMQPENLRVTLAPRAADTAAAT
jgi:cytochrome P450